MLRTSAIAATIFSLLGQAAGSHPATAPGSDESAAQPGRAGRVPSIEERTAGFRKLDGFFPLYWDERTGALLVEIPRLDTDILYATGLSAGLGSNDIGLDRGQEGGGRVVSFHRVGPKVLMVEPNLTFRASSSNAAERKAVEDSFAKSILWGFTVAAESTGRVLVDATEFLLHDFRGAGAALRPGPYHVDRTRSAINMPATKAFPKNTEIDVILTFVNESAGGRAGFGIGPVQGPPPIGEPGSGAGRGGRGGAGTGGGAGGGFGGGMFSGTVASVTPSADAVTLREHASLVELPDGNYRPREDDPRAGYGGMSFVDYSAPLSEPMVRQYLRRHRLQKATPTAPVSDPVRPIVYYVDPGTPALVRQALIEGAGWWSQAFEAAGFRNAFRVEVLPDNVDPMDIRYNMINWVHRSTRGYSSGATVTDPRTGEIIKATVTLGSLRDRQDYLIFEGLLSPYATGRETPAVLQQTAMARLRQLAAHEVGHTLGLGHNYYDSTKGRISVMDYPHPLETLRDDGAIDLSDAYLVGIGEWDKVAIKYGYTEFPRGTEEAAALRKILDDAWGQDLRYLTNQDTDTHPRVDQWSNGVDQAAELARIMRIRRAALNRIGEATIKAGRPMATIEEPLVPIFMYHRYSVESAASMVGGLDYIYAMRGDGRDPVKPVAAADQRRALDALAGTLAPAELTMPKQVLERIPPRPPGFGRHRELFPRATGGGFDPITPGAVAADVTIGFVLELDRAARIVAQHAVDPALPGLEEVIDRLTKATFDASAANEYETEIRRAEEQVLVDRLTWLASAARMPQVRAIASLRLSKLADRLKAEATASEADRALHLLLAADIKRFLERPAETMHLMPVPDASPGAPIGDPGMDWLAPPGCGWSAGRPDWWQ